MSAAPSGYVRIQRGSYLYYIKEEGFNANFSWGDLRTVSDKVLHEHADVVIKNRKIFKCRFNQALMVESFLKQQTKEQQT
jgi:hypothetical protein